MEAAIGYARKNMPTGEHGSVLAVPDVVLGRWDDETRNFDATGLPVNAVQVTTRRAEANDNAVELYFARVLGFEETDVVTGAVAWNGGRGAEFCILALDESAMGAFTANGTDSLDMGECGIGVRSAHPGQAMRLPGTVDVTAGLICVEGGAAVGGDVSLNPGPEILDTGCTPPEDPLAGELSPPPVGPCDFGTDVTPYSFSGSGVPVPPLQPGVYCGGITFTGSNLDVTFEPGIYILAGGGMRFTGGDNTYSGDGLMFYNTDSAGYTFGDIDLGGAATVNFTASMDDDDPYVGILFYQDPSPASAASGVEFIVHGTVTANLDGVIYFPDHQVRYAGTNDEDTLCGPKIVARLVEFNGTNTTIGGGPGCAADKVFLGEKFLQLVD